MTNSNSTTIYVQQIINSTFCVDASDGEKIYTLLYKAISQKEHVFLSFKNIELVITAFLNAAVGKLYEHFTDAEINQYITKTDYPFIFEPTWTKVIEGAPIYYKKKDILDKNLSELIDED